MDDEINLSDIFRVLWKNRFMIIGIFAIFVLVAGAVSFAVMSPSYRSSAIVALGNFEDPIYTTPEFAMAIMQSDEYMLDVIDELDFEVPPEGFTRFKSSIEIKPVNGYQGYPRLLEISAVTRERQEGKEIVETIIRLFEERSRESYNRYQRILSDNLLSTEMRLETTEMDLGQTREVLKSIEDLPVTSTSDKELRISRTLEYLQGGESRRSTFLDQKLELEKQLALMRHLEVVQETRVPVAPIESKKVLMVAVAGMLGLMVGIFAAFLREGLRRPVE
jgi:capsular polysaccharide biosynthesis protein